MAFGNIYRVVQDLEGNVVTGVLVTVTHSGSSTLAALFANAEGTIPLPNPTTNNAQFGSVLVFLTAGLYDLQFVKAGYTFELQSYIEVDDPLAGVTAITGTANRVLVTPPAGTGTVTLSTPQDIAPDSDVQFGRIGLGTPPLGGYRLVTNGVIRSLGGYEAPQNAADGASAFFSDMAAGGSNRWALNCVGSAWNYLGGPLGLQRLPDGSTTLVVAHNKLAGQHGLLVQPVGGDTGALEILFVNNALTPIGSISSTSSAVAYNTTSDPRLKTDIADLPDALETVLQLRPVVFRWKADGSPGHGFLATEVQAVVPDAVTGEAGALDVQGQIAPMQMDMSKLVPWLVGAVQALAARVVALDRP